jgi:hypothetical protein
LSAEISLSQALEKFLKSSKLGNNILALQIEDVWEKLMGKTIARYTDRIHIVNRTLFIHTSVAPLRTELLYQKAQIIARVNEEMGENLIGEVVIQ